MPTTLPTINYTNRDFWSVLTSFETNIKARFPEEWRDFYVSCFTGDTKVSLLTGEEKTLKELEGQEVWVYSYDHKKEKIVPGHGRCVKTRPNAELLLVTLDNGEKIRCTPDHKFMMRDGSYKEAQNLQPNDSLMPLYRRYPKKYSGYEQIKQLDTNRWCLTHRCFAPGEPLEMVHHYNYNKRDNRPFNLYWMSFEEHGKIHNLKERWQNPEQREKLLYDSQSKEGRKRRSEIMKEMWSSPKYREIFLNNGKNSDDANKKKGLKTKELWKNKGYRQTVSKKIKSFWTEQKRKQRSEQYTKLYEGNTELRDKVGRGVRKAFDSGALDKRDQSFMQTEDYKEKQSSLSKKRWGNSKYKRLMSKKHKEYYNLHPETRERISEDVIKRNSDPAFKEQMKLAYAKRNEKMGWNHKVACVEKLTEREDCYCLQIEEHHNFALSVGVFVHNSIGLAIADVVGIAFDNLSFQMDYVANEVLLPTARDRRSIMLIGREVGYQMRTPTSASVQCTASIDTGPYAFRIVIPGRDNVVMAGTAIQSVKGVQFYAHDDITLPVGMESTDVQDDGTGVLITQGVWRIDTTSFTSDDTAFQKFTLPNSPVVQNTIEVETVQGEWTQYDSLAECDDETRGFVMVFDEDGVAYLTFGDGTTGVIPTGDITVRYRTGGGVEGNVKLNDIDATVVGYIDNGLNTPIQIRLRNNTYTGSGGEDAETAEHAKIWIPYWIRANGRAVTESDYDVLATMFNDPVYGSVAYAKSRLKQSLPELNTVEVAIIGRDYAGVPSEASSGLKQALEDYFNNNGVGSVKMVCQHCEVIDGTVLYVDIEVDVKLSTTLTESQMRTNINSGITDLFDSTYIQMGEDFRISWIYNTIQDVPGVQYCIIKELTLSKKDTDYIVAGGATNFVHTVTLESGSEIIPSSVIITGVVSEEEVLTDNGLGDIQDSTGTEVGSIDYETGVCSFYFSGAVTGTYVTFEYRYIVEYARNTESIDTGDGVTVRFKGKVPHPPIVPYDDIIHEKGVAFTDGGQTVMDDGDGNLTLISTGATIGKIDYTSGAYDFTLYLPPGNGVEIGAAYYQLLRTPSQDLPVDEDQICTKGNVTINII